MGVTRGFLGRSRAPRDDGCRRASTTPARTWPVLTAEATPILDLDYVVVLARPARSNVSTRWSWDEIHRLAPSTYDGDIHCVTTWSKLGMHFVGVSVDTLLEVAGVRPEATHVLAWSHTAVHHQPAAGRRDRRQGLGGLGGRRPAPGPPARRAGPAPGARSSTSGRAPSGSPACGCSTMTSPASGRCAATTIAATPGSSSATRVTDR